MLLAESLSKLLDSFELVWVYVQHAIRRCCPEVEKEAEASRILSKTLVGRVELVFGPGSCPRSGRSKTGAQHAKVDLAIRSLGIDDLLRIGTSAWHDRRQSTTRIVTPKVSSIVRFTSLTTFSTRLRSASNSDVHEISFSSA